MKLHYNTENLSLEEAETISSFFRAYMSAVNDTTRRSCFAILCGFAILFRDPKIAEDLYYLTPAGSIYEQIAGHLSVTFW